MSIVVILVFVFLIILFVSKKIGAKNQSGPKRDTDPDSVFNDDLEEYNETLKNDIRIIIVGETPERIKAFIKEQAEIQDQDESFFRMKELNSKMMEMTFPNRWYMPDFYEFLLSLNDSSEEDWKGKAVAWLTVPFMEEGVPKGIPSMVYVISETEDDVLYVTAHDNTCWRITPGYLSYNKTILQQEYRNPPV